MISQHPLKAHLEALYATNNHDEAHALITQALFVGVDDEMHDYLQSLRQKLDKQARRDRQVPSEVENALLDFFIAPEKLWRLKLPVVTLPIDDLKWHLSLPFFWSRPNGFYDVTPQEVLDDKDLLPREYHKVLTADVSYPIFVCFHKDQWLILDGLHRLMKQVLLGRNKVDVHKVPPQQLPTLKR
jgi:hypothetical protein